MSATLALFGCSDVCGGDRLPSCDIRETSCQDVVIAAVGCMRGATVAERPVVTVVTPAEFEAELRAGADPTMMQALHWEDALRRLGMISPDVSLLDAQVESSVATVAAYFSPAENAVYVIDRGIPADSADAVALLLHEMVHAAQHQEHDLEARLMDVDTHEEAIRVRSAVEGEATFYQLEALVWAEGYRPEELAWGDFFDGWMMRTRDTLDASPSKYFVVYGALPYVLGGRRAAAVWEAAGDEGVRRALTDPPSSTELMRDPFALDAAPPPRLASTPCEEAPPPDGFAASSRDEMGPQLIYAFLRADQRMTHAEAWSIAYRWRRDDLYVYGAADGRTALAWRIHMSDTSAPRWVESEVSARGLGGSANGDVVTVLAADPDVLEGWSWAGGPAGCAFP